MKRKTKTKQTHKIVVTQVYNMLSSKTSHLHVDEDTRFATPVRVDDPEEVPAALVEYDDEEMRNNLFEQFLDDSKELLDRLRVDSRVTELREPRGFSPDDFYLEAIEGLSEDTEFVLNCSTLAVDEAGDAEEYVEGLESCFNSYRDAALSELDASSGPDSHENNAETLYDMAKSAAEEAASVIDEALEGLEQYTEPESVASETEEYIDAWSQIEESAEHIDGKNSENLTELAEAFKQESKEIYTETMDKAEDDLETFETMLDAAGYGEGTEFWQEVEAYSERAEHVAGVVGAPEEFSYEASA
jgi:hypothetical protein